MNTTPDSPVIEARNLRVALPDRSRKPMFGAPPLIEILKDVGIAVRTGESVGVVGESGSGKTTLGRTLLRLYEPLGGDIVFEGRDITHLDEAALRPLRARMQMIFQDPQSSLNPRHKVGDIVAQPLVTLGRVHSRAEARDIVAALFQRVGMTPDLQDRYPHQLSGGQRQRVGIARAIAVEPSFIVADEIVSGLDVSVQAQILTLLKQLQREMGLSMIFISHDLSVVRAMCDRVIVMRLGEVVEERSCVDIFERPEHPYTRTLLDAIPLPDVDPDWLWEDGATVDR
jgi:dipeptide transport system ATP-binding protein